jgi:hypothetical protein
MTTKNFNSFYTALTIALIIFVFALTFFIIASEPYPLGSDTYFHLSLAQQYVKGNFAEAYKLMIQQIQFFYPPFFQAVILAPAALSPDPYLGVRSLEALFMPLTFTAILWVTKKYASSKAALFTGITLLASWSFVDGTLQARPESMDLLLLPIIIYAVMEAKKKTAGILSSIIVWGHGLAAISSVFGLFLYKLRDKEWRKTLIAVTIVTIPILILTVAFFKGAIAVWIVGQTVTSNPQQYMFWNNPFPWLLYYCGLSLLGIPYLLRRHKTQFETILTYAFIGNSAMFLVWADRWLHYSAIPWAILFGIGVSRLHGKKLYIAIAATTLIAALYVAIYLETSIFHLWWQPGD